ncbi:hypothetical protein GW755_04195 [bacterium]|nr:hypothetical protein [bacterium]
MKNIRSDYNFKRNNTIIEDYLSNNLSYSELAKKYKLTKQRVAAIIKDMSKKGFTKRLDIKSTKKERDSYLNRAIEIRESGVLKMSEQMFGEILKRDKQAKNYKGAVQVLGHLRIVYTRIAEETESLQEKIKLVEKAEESLKEVQSILKQNKKVFDLGNKNIKGDYAINNVHLASVVLFKANLINTKDKKTALKEALSLINLAIKDLPGTQAHKAWPLRLKGEILFNLGELESAVKTLLLGEQLIFTAYEQEFKDDDQSEIRLNVWLSGIHLTMAKIASETNRKILANHYASSVISVKDPQNVLGERKKEAKRILAKLDI